MTKLERFFLSLMFALLLAGVTLVVTQVPSAAAAPSAQTKSSDCAGCHAQIEDSWMAGLHGHAGNDPVFQSSWEAQGKPGACLVCHVTGYDPATATWKEDGVTCEACHNPIPAEHTTKPSANPVPVDTTSDLCGRCHSDTRFGWEQWKVSAHYQRNMTCSVCHDPHSAAIKTITNESGEVQEVSALCLNCHRDYSMVFPYSNHSQAGVQCVDCHLRHYGAESDGDVHAMPDHSFTANLDSCNTCHAQQMHTVATEVPSLDAHTAATVPPEDPTTEASAGNITSQPLPVSPAGFAGLAALLGLAGGMVLSPWLERLYRRVSRKDEKK